VPRGSDEFLEIQGTYPGRRNHGKTIKGRSRSPQCRPRCCLGPCDPRRPPWEGSMSILRGRLNCPNVRSLSHL